MACNAMYNTSTTHLVFLQVGCLCITDEDMLVAYGRVDYDITDSIALVQLTENQYANYCDIVL